MMALSFKTGKLFNVLYCFSKEGTGESKVDIFEMLTLVWNVNPLG